MSACRYRILIVDDDPALLRLLSMRLSSVGYEVAAVESGEKCIARIPTFQPHLVITDLRMDGMDGMALFDQIHERSPALPVIILTAHGSIPEAVDATSRGVFGYLTKPFDSKDLLEQVTRALRITGEQHERSEEESVAEWRQDIVTRSPLMEDLLGQTLLVASSDASIFIHGQSGTGKELLARAIHKASSRASGEFVAVNCSAIPEALFESEFFGHVKGSFTGATRDHKGLFQAASGGTLFLDEIGDMPMSFQVKLLRAIQESSVRPVGATQTQKVDVRFLSATHSNLEDLRNSGAFREDLYYRLNVVSLDLSLIHISEPTRRRDSSRMPSSA